MRAVVVLMATIIFVSPLIWSRHYLIKTGSGEEDGGGGGGGGDYSGLGGDNVLDCATNSKNYFCRHIAQLFNNYRTEEMETEE